MSADSIRTTETSALGVATATHEPVRWRCRWELCKYRTDDYAAGRAPYEVIADEGNALMYGGASALWTRLIGDDSTSAFDSASATIGVGDGTAEESPSDTDLQGTNTERQGMDSGYPSHTDGTSSGAHEVEFQAVFGEGAAEFAWEEWAVFNASDAGRMLNRRVESLGTKGANSTWTLTVTLSLS